MSQRSATGHCLSWNVDTTIRAYAFQYRPDFMIYLRVFLYVGADWADVQKAAALLRRLQQAEEEESAAERGLAAAVRAKREAADGKARADEDALAELRAVREEEGRLKQLCGSLRDQVNDDDNDNDNNDQIKPCMHAY
eukprot:scaffold83556_cov21-Prasinocladus_malaysianus.AAC.2